MRSLLPKLDWTRWRPAKGRSGAHRIEWGLLVWIAMAQFPLPVIHSHEALASLCPAALTAHLDRHHFNRADQKNELADHGTPVIIPAPTEEQDWHWHFVLPVELMVSHRDHEDAAHELASYDVDAPIASSTGWWHGGAHTTHAVLMAGDECRPIFAPRVSPLDRDGVACDGIKGMASARIHCRDSAATQFFMSYRGVSILTLTRCRLI